MKKRLLSLILLATLLVGLMCPIGAANDTGEKAEASQGAIVYIPLDDRPLNLRRVQQLADSLDLQLILPDTDLYATKLDDATCEAINKVFTEVFNDPDVQQQLADLSQDQVICKDYAEATSMVNELYASYRDVADSLGILAPGM